MPISVPNTCALFLGTGRRADASRRRLWFTLMSALAVVLAACGAGTSNPGQPAAPSNLVYSQTTIAATAGQAIAADMPTVMGTVASYTVSPMLPAGLSLSAATGAISGTPTAVAAQASYTVTASNARGGTTATLQISVIAAVVPPSNLVYPQTTIKATVGQAIAADVPTVTGTVTSYSVIPALPAGLSLNVATGTISGTPAAAAALVTYTVTASNSAGSTAAGVQISVVAAVTAPTNLVYPQTTIKATVGQAIAANVPTVTGTVTSYSVIPALPAGLSLNVATGTISGTPTAAAAQAAYTVTASNSAGSTAAAVMISVVLAVPPPSNLVYPQPVIAATAGQAITVDVPTVTGTVTSYTISPALPAGLVFNTSTGAISGIPAVAAVLTVYRVTATNSAGSTTAGVSISVDAVATPPSNLNYPQTAITVAVGQAIVTDIPNVTGTVASYSVSPALPAGIALNSSTGALSGASTTAMAQVPYVVTAANASGSTTATITITVTKALTTLLDLGHIALIRTLRVTPTRALSEDGNGHWLLSDFTSGAALGTALASGDSFVAVPQTPTFTWPIDMAGPTVAIGITNGVEVRSAADGHLLSTITGLGIDSPLPNAGASWWKLASDGSYVSAGSAAGFSVWAPNGALLVTRPGDYSAAKVFAAPGEVDVALGPAGQSVIETISTGDGTSVVGPAFNGQFNTWFVDGGRFLTNLSNTVWTYSKAGAQQAIVALPQFQNLAGEGNWVLTYGAFASGEPLMIFPVGSNSPAANYPVGADAAVVPSAMTVGVLPYGYGAASVIDLSGTTPAKVDYTVPIAYLTTYAANSPKQWLVGNERGVVIDGPSAATTPKYFSQGVSYSAAGSGSRVAFTTASGSIDFFDPSTATLEGTISFPASKLALSSDGSVLAAAASTNVDSQYEPDRTLKIFSLPSGTVTTSFPYQLDEQNGTPDLFDFSLSGSGTVLGRLVGTYNINSGWSYVRLVTPTTGSPTIWTDTQPDPIDPILLSPDGTLIAISSSPRYPSSITMIYKNGALVTAVAGAGVGWIDNGRLLVDKYAPPSRFQGSVYIGSTIYSATGSNLGAPAALPELFRFQTVTPDTVYAPGTNQIFSLTTGQATWTGSEPLSGSAAVSTGYVTYVTGTRVVVESY